MIIFASDWAKLNKLCNRIAFSPVILLTCILSQPTSWGFQRRRTAMDPFIYRAVGATPFFIALKTLVNPSPHGNASLFEKIL